MIFFSSCVITTREGVITLYDNSLECSKSKTNDEGRVAILVIENDKPQALVVNLHYPNDYNAFYLCME